MCSNQDDNVITATENDAPITFTKNTKHPTNICSKHRKI